MDQSNNRTIDVFFYGLFMDADLLREKGIRPVDSRQAAVDNFQIRIAQRATLVPSNGDVVYGMVFSLTHDEIHNLYADPSVNMYRPEAVLARLPNGNSIPCLCFNVPGFNLPTANATDERNPDYAAKLRALAARLNLPDSYVKTI